MVTRPCRSDTEQVSEGAAGVEVVDDIRKLLAESPSPEQPTLPGVWADRPDTFSMESAQALRHTFHQHPLLQLPELTTLGKALALTDRCRFRGQGASVESAFRPEHEDSTSRSVDEAFRHIEEPGSWVALYEVEQHPLYRALLGDLMASLRSLAGPHESRLSEPSGVILIATPPSMTPFHIDREHLCWLQVRGRRHVAVWDHADATVVSNRARESFIVRTAPRELSLPDDVQERRRAFDVGPGEGVYCPSTSPYMTRTDADWTRPGDRVSVSIGVSFHTAFTRRRANVHVWNRHLRRAGITPRPPGNSAFVDRLKYPCGKAAVWLGKTLYGRAPRPGF